MFYANFIILLNSEHKGLIFKTSEHLQLQKEEQEVL